MDYHQIENFCKVYECGTIPGASRELFISEQGLSKSILKCEREIGFDLFKRTTRGLELTEAGSMVLEKAKCVIKAMKEFDAGIEAIRKGSPQNCITIGFYCGFLGNKKSPLSVIDLLKFEEMHPETLLTIYEYPNDRVVKMVRNGSLDLGICVGEVSGDLLSLELLKVNLVWAVNKNNPLARKEAIAWSDLEGQRVIHLNSKSDMDSNIRRICKKSGANVASSSIYVSDSTALECVYENVGVCLLDRRHMDQADEDRVVFKPIAKEAGFLRPPVSVIWNPQSELKYSYEEIIEYIRDTASSKRLGKFAD